MGQVARKYKRRWSLMDMRVLPLVKHMSELYHPLYPESARRLLYWRYDECTVVTKEEAEMLTAEFRKESEKCQTASCSATQTAAPSR